MSKVLSAVFGIGIAVVVYVSMLLGIQAFYPAPDYDDFCTEQIRYSEPMLGYEGCTDDMTLGQCRQAIKEGEAGDTKMQKCHEDWDKAEESYSRNFFIIASILGVLAVLVSFFLFIKVTGITVTNITAGIACSGIVMILWAFIRGWEGTDDKLKFVVGLIIAAIVITLSVILNKKMMKKK
jgi:VIT1/CCC1 family predicted Fe2+/Mn2+ transporter